MAYSSSPRGSGGGYSNKPSPRKTNLEEGPIKDLVQVMETTRPEQWQRRTAALADLVSKIPAGAEYARRESWYNSPPTLRHMHQPVSELLKDPRSTVVKRCCESMSILFNQCQGDAKYLFKDLMPAVLMVHAQTVQVIRAQVQTLICEAILLVPCKMAMPLWLERLKTDKSRTVREACVLYLGMGLKHWSIVDNDSGNPYLTEENWMQIGMALIKVLRDPSPVVRDYAKKGVKTIWENQPDLWDDLIRDPDGPAGKDAKLQKWLIKVSEEGEMQSANNDGELSVASRYSHRSSYSKGGAGAGAGAPSTPAGAARTGGFNATRSASRGRAGPPMSISVGGKQTDKPPPRQARGGLGPPLRRPFGQALDSGGSEGSSNGYAVPVLGTPPRPPVAGRPPHMQRSPSPSPRRPEPRHKIPARSRSASSASIGSSGKETQVEEGEDNRSVVSQLVAPRPRARPTPEVLNGGVPPKPTPIEPDVIDLVDSVDESNNNGGKPSPPGSNHQQDPPAATQQQQYSRVGVYSQASSTEMLDVTKIIDQTLAQVETQPGAAGTQQTKPVSPAHEEDEEGPFIASMNELKQHASRRRSRRSIHMKERWSRGESIGNGIGSPAPQVTTVPVNAADAVSSLGGSMMYNQEDANKPLPPTPALPEHYIIAEQLLRVHKTHVDQIMETLKIEMDTLRDFEQSLEQEQSPSPDQVLDYFESVGLCLDQRTTAGNILQREMDRISKGAFGAVNKDNNNNNAGGR